jgi:hypothetical protein
VIKRFAFLRHKIDETRRPECAVQFGVMAGKTRLAEIVPVFLTEIRGFYIWMVAAGSHYGKGLKLIINSTI